MTPDTPLPPPSTAMWGKESTQKHFIALISPYLKKAGYTFDQFLRASSLEKSIPKMHKGRKRPSVDKTKLVKDATPFDVILGRGTDLSCHPGNWLFRNVVAMNKVEYQKRERHEKVQVSKALKFHFEEAGSRFIEPISSHGGKTVHAFVDDGRAIEKFSQGMREKKFTLAGLVPMAMARAKPALERALSVSSTPLRENTARKTARQMKLAEEADTKKKVGTKKSTKGFKKKTTTVKRKSAKTTTKSAKVLSVAKTVTPKMKRSDSKKTPVLSTPQGKASTHFSMQNSALRPVTKAHYSQTPSESEFAATVSLSSTEGGSPEHGSFARVTPLRPVTLASLAWSQPRSAFSRLNQQDVAAFTQSFQQCARYARAMLRSKDEHANELFSVDTEAADLGELLRPSKLRKLSHARIQPLPCFHDEN